MEYRRQWAVLMNFSFLFWNGSHRVRGSVQAEMGNCIKGRFCALKSDKNKQKIKVHHGVL